MKNLTHELGAQQELEDQGNEGWRSYHRRSEKCRLRFHPETPIRSVLKSLLGRTREAPTNCSGVAAAEWKQVLLRASWECPPLKPGR